MKSGKVSAVATTQKGKQNSDAKNAGHEAKYWRMADALRGDLEHLIGNYSPCVPISLNRYSTLVGRASLLESSSDSSLEGESH